MNSCDFIGRLTRDPEIRYSTGQDHLCIARFTLAVDRKGGEKTDFLSFKALGKGGEFAEKHLKKGQQIGVHCRAEAGSYEKDGQKVYYTEFVVEEYTFCGSKQDNGSSTNNGNDGRGTSGDDFMSIPDGADEELPFNQEVHEG